MRLIARVHGTLKARAARGEAAEYRRDLSPIEVEQIQLRLLNAAWSESLDRSSVARRLQESLGLSIRFDSMQDFRGQIGVLTKEDLRPVLQSESSAPGCTWRATGGTTSSPFRFPIFKSESRVAARDIWYARGRVGIRPWDRAFLLWGHSHLLGAGLKGLVSRAHRALADRLLGYTRFSAYDLSSTALLRAGEALVASKARYVVGYSQALELFARENARRRGDIHALNLAAVIATGEGFRRPEAPAELESVFGAPVVMEYGSVETGPIAYELERGSYTAFWRHHLLELENSPEDDAAPLLVTSLYPRALPLLRYRIGDLVVPRAGLGVTKGFSKVLGRINDLVYAEDGTAIHSEAISHVLRDHAALRAFQVRQRGTALPTIIYESTEELSQGCLLAFRERLRRIHPSLERAGFERVEALGHTVAGKRAMVIHE